MSVLDVNRFRSFYARHPFGLIRGDLQAYMAGSQARTGFGKGMKPEQALKLCDYFGNMMTRSQRRRRKRLERRKPMAKPPTVEQRIAMAKAMGAEIIDLRTKA